jgi:hypothetical protein
MAVSGGDGGHSHEGFAVVPEPMLAAETQLALKRLLRPVDVAGEELCEAKVSENNHLQIGAVDLSGRFQRYLEEGDCFVHGVFGQCDTGGIRVGSG